MKKTLPFETTSGDYFSVLASLWVPRYGWLVLLPVIICAVIGVVADERFLLVALILLFIVAPMVMSYLYTYYMLTPEVGRTVIRKEVEIADGDYIRITYLEPEKRNEGEGKAEPKNRMLLPIAKEEDRQPLPPPPLPKPEKILWKDVLSVKYTSRFVVYLLRGPRLSFILVPYSALPREIKD